MNINESKGNTMEDEVVAAITIKGMNPDEHGLPQYVWATKKQAERLLAAQFDEKQRTFVFMLGDRGFRPCDVLGIKMVKIKEARRYPAFRRYVLDALQNEKEQAEALEKPNNAGLKRLSDLKAEHNLTRSDKNGR